MSYLILLCLSFLFQFFCISFSCNRCIGASCDLVNGLPVVDLFHLVHQCPSVLGSCVKDKLSMDLSLVDQLSIQSFLAVHSEFERGDCQCWDGCIVLVLLMDSTLVQDILHAFSFRFQPGNFHITTFDHLFTCCNCFFHFPLNQVASCKVLCRS